MAVGNWNLQWLNHNSQRAYPFAADSSLQDKTGTLRLPDSFVLAMQLPIHAGLAVVPEKFFLKTLGLYATGYSLVFAYDDGANYPSVAGVTVARSAHAENQSYAVSGIGDYDDTAGTIVIGDTTEIDQQPAGLYEFLPADAYLDTDAIRPMIRGISSLTVVNGSERSPRITDDVELVAGRNFRILANIISGQAPEIVFNAISGEGLNEVCECEDDDEGPAMRFINGIPPLPDGNFRMVGDQCVRIDPSTNGLEFSDICSAPCCGSEELDAVRRQLDRLTDGAATVQTFVRNLSAEVTQMSQTVLGSKLSDQGCTVE